MKNTVIVKYIFASISNLDYEIIVKLIGIGWVGLGVVCEYSPLLCVQRRYITAVSNKKHCTVGGAWYLFDTVYKAPHRLEQRVLNLHFCNGAFTNIWVQSRIIRQCFITYLL